MWGGGGGEMQGAIPGMKGGGGEGRPALVAGVAAESMQTLRTLPLVPSPNACTRAEKREEKKTSLREGTGL